MTIQITYDKRQVLQALRYHFISRPEIRVMLILVNVFALTCVVLYMFKKVAAFALLTGTVMWLFLMISFWLVLPGMVYRRAATFRDSFTMHFEDSGFSVGNERGSRAFQWITVSDFLESPNFFHLYFDSRSFFLVPKDCLKSRDDVFELRQLLKSKVKRRAR
jgi:hypothetical protein